MELKQSRLNHLCELCKKDFPPDAPWPCFEMINPDKLGSSVFRTSSMKHLRDSCTHGCHICSMVLWQLRDGENCVDCASTMSGDYVINWTLSEVEHQICWRLGVRTGPQGDHEAVVLLSRVVGVPRRDCLGDVIWKLDLASIVRGPPVQTAAAQSTSPVNIGPHTITQIREWLHTCENAHEQCKANLGLIANRDAESFRLIDIGNGDIPTVRLVDSGDLSQPLRYTTLSHRWTNATKFTQLTWAKVEHNYKNLDTSSWPQVYKDALLYTRQLNIQYLWIDSICIIQDAKAGLITQDWDEQSVLMSQIYANGVVNLVGLDEEDGSGFTVHRNLLTEFPCVLPSRKERDDSTVTQYLFYSDDYYRQAVSLSPLSKRGWIFQERLLSKRAVFFGRQIHWECLSLSACDAFPSGHDTYRPEHRSYRSYRHQRDKDLMQIMRADLSLSINFRAEDTLDHFFEMWDRVLVVYKHTQLSQLSDRLVALRGVVSLFQERFSFPPTAYKAGIWEPCISLSLLWFINKLRHRPHNEDDLRTRKTLLRHFPSWSWASCMGNVCYRHFYDYINHDESYTDAVDFITLQGSDDKAKDTLPTELILRGWIGNVGYPDIKPRSIGFGDTCFKLIIGDTGFFYSINWDMDAPASLESTKALTIKIHTKVGTNGGCQYVGLILESVDADDDVPTYMRIGSYKCDECPGYDPLIDPGFELKNREERKQALMSAPVIRLV